MRILTPLLGVFFYLFILNPLAQANEECSDPLNNENSPGNSKALVLHSEEILAARRNAARLVSQNWKSAFLALEKMGASALATSLRFSLLTQQGLLIQGARHPALWKQVENLLSPLNKPRPQDSPLEEDFPWLHIFIRSKMGQGALPTEAHSIAVDLARNYLSLLFESYLAMSMNQKKNSLNSIVFLESAFDLSAWNTHIFHPYYAQNSLFYLFADAAATAGYPVDGNSQIIEDASFLASLLYGAHPLNFILPEKIKWIDSAPAEPILLQPSTLKALQDLMEDVFIPEDIAIRVVKIGECMSQGLEERRLKSLRAAGLADNMKAGTHSSAPLYQPRPYLSTHPDSQKELVSASLQILRAQVVNDYVRWQGSSLAVGGNRLRELRATASDLKSLVHLMSAGSFAPTWGEKNEAPSGSYWEQQSRINAWQEKLLFDKCLDSVLNLRK